MLEVSVADPTDSMQNGNGCIVMEASNPYVMTTSIISLSDPAGSMQNVNGCTIMEVPNPCVETKSVLRALNGLAVLGIGISNSFEVLANSMEELLH